MKNRYSLKNLTATEISNRFNTVKAKYNPPAFAVAAIDDMYDRVCCPPIVYKDPYSLGCCTATTLANPANVWDDWHQYNEETPPLATKKTGNNPMIKSNTTTTDVTINATQPSDAMLQRDFLLKEFTEKYSSWRRNEQESDLAEMFNLNAPTKPSSWAELTAAIAGGKFKFDQAKFDRKVAEWMSDEDMTLEEATKIVAEGFGMFGFVTFTDLPKADRKGYDAALLEFRLAKEATKQDIMILDPKDGLLALRALDAWKPTGKAN